MKIIDYEIVLSWEVEVYLKEGWQPFGSPFYSEIRDKAYQAVVKYSSKSIK